MKLSVVKPLVPSGSYVHAFQHIQENKLIITNDFNEAGITDRLN